MRLEGDRVVFANKGTMLPKEMPTQGAFFSSRESRLAAKAIVEGWDIDVVEAEWREWMIAKGLDRPKDPDKAFLDFCRKFRKTRGPAR